MDVIFLGKKMGIISKRDVELVMENVPTIYWSLLFSIHYAKENCRSTVLLPDQSLCQEL
jgi:hypothetical protein